MNNAQCCPAATAGTTGSACAPVCGCKAGRNSIDPQRPFPSVRRPTFCWCSLNSALRLMRKICGYNTWKSCATQCVCPVHHDSYTFACIRVLPYTCPVAHGKPVTSYTCMQQIHLKQVACMTDTPPDTDHILTRLCLCGCATDSDGGTHTHGPREPRCAGHYS
jgi:hypothetical protein